MVLIEGPFCNTILKLNPPNKLHTAFSFVTHNEEVTMEKIVKTKNRCPNGNCEKSIIIKWFAPLEYFNQL
jgi:hypothetical protein